MEIKKLKIKTQNKEKRANKTQVKEGKDEGKQMHGRETSSSGPPHRNHHHHQSMVEHSEEEDRDDETREPEASPGSQKAPHHLHEGIVKEHEGTEDEKLPQ